MSDEQELYLNSDWMYSLLRAPDGTLIIQAVVGGFGMYMVRVRLTPEEAAAYTREGIPFIDRMAKDIISNPGFHGRAETWNGPFSPQRPR